LLAAGRALRHAVSHLLFGLALLEDTRYYARHGFRAAFLSDGQRFRILRALRRHDALNFATLSADATENFTARLPAKKITGLHGDAYHQLSPDSHVSICR